MTSFGSTLAPDPVVDRLGGLFDQFRKAEDEKFLQGLRVVVNPRLPPDVAAMCSVDSQGKPHIVVIKNIA